MIKGHTNRLTRSSGTCILKRSYPADLAKIPDKPSGKSHSFYISPLPLRILGPASYKLLALAWSEPRYNSTRTDWALVKLKPRPPTKTWNYTLHRYVCCLPLCCHAIEWYTQRVIPFRSFRTLKPHVGAATVPKSWRSTRVIGLLACNPRCPSTASRWPSPAMCKHPAIAETSHADGPRSTAPPNSLAAGQPALPKQHAAICNENYMPHNSSVALIATAFPNRWCWLTSSSTISSRINCCWHALNSSNTKPTSYFHSSLQGHMSFLWSLFPAGLTCADASGSNDIEPLDLCEACTSRLTCRTVHCDILWHSKNKDMAGDLGWLLPLECKHEQKANRPSEVHALKEKPLPRIQRSCFKCHLRCWTSLTTAKPHTTIRLRTTPVVHAG